MFSTVRSVKVAFTGVFRHILIYFRPLQIRNNYALDEASGQPEPMPHLPSPVDRVRQFSRPLHVIFGKSPALAGGTIVPFAPGYGCSSPGLGGSVASGAPAK